MVDPFRSQPLKEAAIIYDGVRNELTNSNQLTDVCARISGFYLRQRSLLELFEWPYFWTLAICFADLLPAPQMNAENVCLV